MLTLSLSFLLYSKNLNLVTLLLLWAVAALSHEMQQIFHSARMDLSCMKLNPCATPAPKSNEEGAPSRGQSASRRESVANRNFGLTAA